MMSSCKEDYKEVIVDGDEDEETRLPGFRFHPTDEELVTFYLKRKVQKKSISVEIIKQIDIYKHDPWELAKASSVGDKEWYFYCKRERKYRNSVRPNRVTSSGFWKATGIDKPIYSNGGEGHQCVGLKKSLVYYRGSAGKGTKTEWMMHEFRLPSEPQHSPGVNPRDTLQEAEVWTLCRIFKRNRKYAPDWREISSKRSTMITNTTITSSKTCSSESTNEHECYINFGNMKTHQQHIPESYSIADCRNTEFARQSCREQSDTKSMVAGPSMAHMSASDASIFSSPLKPSSSVDDQAGQFIAAYDGNWDDLSSVVEFATRAPLL